MDYLNLDVNLLQAEITYQFPIFLKYKESQSKFCLLVVGQILTTEKLKKVQEVSEKIELFTEAKFSAEVSELIKNKTKILIIPKNGTHKEKFTAIHSGIKSIFNQSTSKTLDLDLLKSISSEILHLVTPKSETSKLDEIIKQIPQSGDLSEHSALVSSISVIFAILLDINSAGALQSLSLAGLIHDLSLNSFTSDQQKQYLKTGTIDESGNDSSNTKSAWNNHPSETIKILRANKIEFNDQVKQIIEQHHEYSDGSGFPEGRRDLSIFFLSKIFTLADVVARDLQNNPNQTISEILLSFLVKPKSNLVNRKIISSLLEAMK